MLASPPSIGLPQTIAAAYRARPVRPQAFRRVTRAHGQQSHGTRVGYLPGLDGLRALAVLGVLLYHAAPQLLPGGFLGVELFFVLSGYLITSLLLAEWRRSGRIELRTFWLRRARRLLPAVVALLAATLAICSAFMPDELAQVRGDAVAALGYVANWHLIFGQVSYFEAIGRPPLLRHLWSLAVEEQFYLVWPPLLLVGLSWWRRPGPLLGLAIAGALASSLLMACLYPPDADPSRVYYGTDTRASGPLIGAALALVSVLNWPRCHLRPWQVDLLGVASLTALVAVSLRLSDAEPGLYRGGFLGVDLLVALLLLAVVQPRGRMNRLLSRQPLRWLGLRSYAIYLWHGPVFALTRPELDVPLDGWPLLAFRFLLTGALAELSYRLVELPIRNGALGRAWHTWTSARGLRRWWLGVRWAGAGAALLAGTAVMGTTVAAARPPERPAYLASDALDTWSQVDQTSVPVVDTGGAQQPALNDAAASDETG
ncbi:MAG: acyltransferase, partial [Chloroflexi bacterium]|nr:acyltransferase [Chloroflexota bacterium]